MGQNISDECDFVNALNTCLLKTVPGIDQMFKI